MSSQPIPYPNETIHGPSPRPNVIESPSLHVLGADDPYADTQTMDTMRDGDVFTIEGTNVVGMLVKAWPVVLHGEGEGFGLHTLAPDADVRTLGAERWGRLMTLTICPVDGEPYPHEEYLPVRGGSDYSASVALAARVAAREPLTDDLETCAHGVNAVFGDTRTSDDLAAATVACAHAMPAARLRTWEGEAYELGAEHARNAATWTVDGNASAEHAARVLAMLDDGDPEAWDYLPTMPNLSGEYAGDPTPLSVARDITNDDDPAGDVIDALAEAWERGVSETFESACAAELRAAAPADTSDDDCADHGYETCPDCGNAGTKIGATGYETCTRFRSCWSDDDRSAEPDAPSDDDLRAVYSGASRYFRDLAHGYGRDGAPHATRDNATRLARLAETLHGRVGR